MRKSRRILLVGGGSGGHIIPNLAVASAIHDKDPNAELLYIASRSKLDRELLERTDFTVYQIFSGKLRRYFSWRNFIDPFFVLLGFLQSLVILRRFKPDVIFSKGGYVSLPVVVAAYILRIRIILHESDSRMGLANRLASKFATLVCVAFPKLESLGSKYTLTGNPVRPEIAEGDPRIGYQITGFKKQLPVLLVWGGSQGAAQINRMIEQDFKRFTKRFQIVHITGAGKSIAMGHPHYVHFEYLDEELKHIYAITNMVIGRAGANSLYEIAYLQKPQIIIPLRNSDQLGNAHYFESKGAAIVLWKGKNLFDLAHHLWEDKALQSKMKKALGDISGKGANEEIVKLILD